jgi:heme O synthase-like polyprenyltransferase
MFDESTTVGRWTAAQSARRWGARVWKYVEVTKPSTVALLVFTCLGAMVAAGGVGHLGPGLDRHHRRLCSR